MVTKQEKHTGKSWLVATIAWGLSILLAFWIGRQMVISADYPLAAATYVILSAHEKADNEFVTSVLAKDAVLTASKRLSKSEKANINTILSAKDWYQQLVRSYALGYWTGTHWESPPVGRDWVRMTEDYVEGMALISIRYRDEDWEFSMLTMRFPENGPPIGEYFFKHPFKRKK